MTAAKQSRRTFALRGVQYEIDLNPKNAAALDKALAKYVSAARRVKENARSGHTTTRPARSNANDGSPTIRKWARAHGYTVAQRGRIPGEVRSAYEHAGG